jgi:glycosyltransferase involved in cell wall biosynthesis
MIKGNNDLVTICIPVYEMSGKGVDYLKHSLLNIVEQDYPSIQVVVSDHSPNSIIEELCNEFTGILNIKHVFNRSNIGSSSANLNNAVRHADGTILKILFQDDFLLHDKAITLQVESLINSDKRWCITACAHTQNGTDIIDPYYPVFNADILFTNTLSSPSTLMLYRENYQQADSNLLWFMDTDCYYRLYLTTGEPVICQDVNIVNRRHPNQITNTVVDSKLISFEREYLKQKYNL